ncbi:Glycogen recognition site of AMP-activated protein kinase [Mucilaginibacter pineti]|uniref:Glycogen recognition site of AMP-activated protein kinase n=1 Tax=Mucilaginibacter pineti TaxID=1391627 RepID=A0A1G7BHE6_9SPHI|nr:hypothetical protein [Mucilaginibacter pineti]SDE26454.1 Glycogen recognition site of AMP-activated protein kinase [Mucilaginibacter pineti]
MNRSKSIFIAFLLLTGIVIGAGAQTRNNLILGNDHLILLIDLRSSKSQLDSILKAAGIKGANTNDLLKGDFTALTKDGWNVTERQKNVIQFNRSLTDLNINAQGKPYLITTNLSSGNDENGRPGYPADEAFGINNFSKVSVHELPTGITRFFLPGFLQAKRVLLSGSFNNWSTLKGVMTKTDSGWVADAKLAAGVYEYKYIIDGRWQRDRNNFNKHPDGFNDVNSVYYRYNYTFKLPGFANAHKVTLAGSFNNWDAGNIILEKKGGVWQKQLYLHDGPHAYRFLVDGKWTTDSANPATEKGTDGITNSVINRGETVNFKLNGHPDAKKVYIAGSFNGWKPDQINMKKVPGGWGISLIIPAGNYGYKFIFDGNWTTDPQNPRHVIEGGEVNSFIAVKPNYTFKLSGYSNAKSVRIAGNFNDWDPDGLVMDHTGNQWTINIFLKKGKYRYKFMVDGQWVRDPANKLWEQNEYNTGNSVLWIE